MVTVVSGAGVLEGHEQYVDEDLGDVGEHINSPFVSGVGASGGVGFKEGHDVG